MDIGNIIFNISEIKKFINSKFRITTFNREALLLNNHSLCASEFNMELEEGKKYTCFNLPVIDLYAYREATDKVCLYILMDLNREKLFSFVKHSRQPEHVLPEDIVSGNFDFLAWHNSDLDLSMMKDRFQRSEIIDHFRVVIRATNIKNNTLLADLRYLF